MSKKTKRDKPADIVFVLDATISTQCVFMGMIDYVSSIIFDITTKFRRALVYCGAVIYRDPVDYHTPHHIVPLDRETQVQLDQSKARERVERRERLRKKGLYDEYAQEREREQEERRKLFDNVKYPEDKNVAIDLIPDTEKLIKELEKVECKGGNDEPEDWVGALDIALNDISWRDKSKKIIIWIADANAHGQRYCGFENHQEEEKKLEPLVKQMVKENIYFAGINIIRSNDEGCRQTFNEIEKIYQKHNGKSINIREVELKLDIDNEKDDVPLQFLESFEETLAQTIRREFPAEIFS